MSRHAQAAAAGKRDAQGLARPGPVAPQMGRAAAVGAQGEAWVGGEKVGAGPTGGERKVDGTHWIGVLNVRG